MEDQDVVDRAADALGFDPVANAERAKQQNQHAASKVRQAALQRQTDGQTRGTDGGHERGRFDTDHRRDADDQ